MTFLIKDGILTYMDNVISSKDARNQFAEILNQVVYQGREFTISRFDKPVAKISPIHDKKESEDEEFIRRKKLLAKIMTIRKKLKGVDLTKIVVRERDKEYRKWTR